MSWSFLKITSSSKNAYFWLWRPPKVTKKCKNRLIFFSSCMGYGVRKMTARWWGVFLDIRTSRQNAYFFIFWGFKGQKRAKKVKNDHYFLFFCMGKWDVQNDRTGVGSIFGYQDDTPKCLFFYFWGGLDSKEGRKGSKITQKKVFVY